MTSLEEKWAENPVEEAERPDVRPLDVLPVAPLNDRVLILPDPVSDKAGALWVPDVAKQYRNTGVLLAAGLSALDKMHDNGILVGDRVQFGKFAGLISEWDHVVKIGATGCPHERHEWGARRKVGDNDMYDFDCEKCGAVRRLERIIVCHIEDIMADESLADRLANHEAQIVRKTDTQGRTCHKIERSTP